MKQSPHHLGPLSLNVSFIEATEEEHITGALGQGNGERDSNDEKDITIVVSGTLPSAEDLWDYFENKRKSGGGEVLKVNVIEEGVEAIITFAEVKGTSDLMKFRFTVVYGIRLRGGNLLLENLILRASIVDQLLKFPEAHDNNT